MCNERELNDGVKKNKTEKQKEVSTEYFNAVNAVFIKNCTIFRITDSSACSCDGTIVYRFNDFWFKT